MQVELSIIKLFLQYSNWEEYGTKVEAKDFPAELQLLYRCLNSFHSSLNENKVDLNLNDLANLFFSNAVKDKEYYQQVFDNLATYEPVKSTVVELISALHRTKLLQKLSLLSYEVAEGKKSYDELGPLLDSIKSLENVEEQEETFVTTDLSVLLQNTYQNPGLRWRLPSLNKSLGSLRKGDFGFIFARPETGKTTLIASEVSHMIDQTDKDIIWVNNEEQGDKVMLRVYQAYFGVTLQNLYGNIKKYSDTFNTRTEGRFKLFDKANTTKGELERLLSKSSPGLLVIDQIDKISGFKADRDDLMLGSIYIWARELAKTYCPVIGVCQADGTGEGVRWLTMGHVANAKTAKQAEADFILGVGMVHDPGWELVRFMNISKNKLLGDEDTDPKQRHAKFEVLIEPEIARYKDFK